MLKFKGFVVASVLIFSSLSVLAQNNTNSPYTRYGLGELADRSFGAGRAMGGVGYGLRSSRQINPLNPASYTSIDSMTFIFDFGMAGQVSWYNDGINSQRNINGNVEYVALQFPITKWMAFSAGVLPYSYVGYDYGEYNATNKTQDAFNGKGGLNDLYGGLSIDIWKKRLSVGANVGFLFGSISHNESFLVLESGSVNEYRERKVDVRDVKLDFGVQYVHPVGKRERVVIGAAFSPSKKLNTTTTETWYTVDSSASTIVDSKGDTIKSKNTYQLPNSIGVGASYQKDDKLLLAADFLYEDWANVNFTGLGTRDGLKNRYRVAAGIEYIPNHLNNRKFLDRVRYRGGFHYSSSYLKVMDKSYNEYGASVGIGLPLLDNRSLINLSFEYVKIKPEARPLIDEQYFRFTVNYTFNEYWFFKFKVN